MALRWSSTVRSSHDALRRGGDVFEAFADESAVTVFLADVSSKQILGILHAEMLRAEFVCGAALALQPHEILLRLNRVRLSSPRRGADVTFASAFVARFDRVQREMCYASAGHELAFLFAGRAHRHLKPSGPIIGIVPDAKYGSVRHAFGFEDLLVLATDGVSEARNAASCARRFGTAGIVSAVGSNVGSSPGSTAWSVMQSADVFCGGVYRDDATVAVVRYA